jgi:CRISPR/Cas system endoribonuclease Cas6 (RAMP superfamily)
VTLRLAARLREPLDAPPFAGSMLRGALFASALDVSCVVDHRRCDDCRLVADCVVPALFEGDATRREEPSAAFLPKPYLLRLLAPRELAGEAKARLEAGTEIAFEIALFGAATEHATLVAAWLERTLERGLGRRRARADVLAIERIDAAAHAESLAARAAELPRRNVVVRLESPLRLPRRGRIEIALPFERLVASLLRRAASLLECHESIALDADPRALVGAARSVAVVSSRLRKIDRVRRSSRQDRSMNLIAIEGEVEFEGDVSSFRPLLAFAERCGAGKGATFGFGRLRCIAPDGPS